MDTSPDVPAAAETPTAVAPTPARKTPGLPEKKYKCQFCSRAFSRSEHRSRHERSHTKERPFKCLKCRSTFVRRDLLLRHDRTVHAKDGGTPLVSEVKRRPAAKAATPKTAAPKRNLELDTATLEQIEASSDGMVDLETAAMLMTDFHHKATAAMAAQENELDEPPVPYSPDHTTMFDNSVPYLSSALPMPQMPWDTFMAQPVNQPKAHSISSSVSGSQDSHVSQLSFNSASTVQPNHNQLPPLMERYPSGGDALAPGLQSLTGSMPISGPGTPNGLSPWPFMTGPVSPVDYRRSPGPSQPITSPKAPQIQSDEEYNRIYEHINQLNIEQSVSDFQLQSRTEVNACLSAYFNLFHHHMPFLHPESFHPGDTPAPLLLAILSIGALYTFNQDQAYRLHIGSKVLVNGFLQNKDFDSRKCPLYIMQSTLLNMIFASWSGDPKGLEFACSIKSLLAQMVAGNLYELKSRSDAREGALPTHEAWLEDEGCRRTYYAVYIFFGMMTLTYNHTPAISFGEFDSLDLPSSESLWNLEVSDEDSWREHLTRSTIITVRVAHDSLFQGEPARYSAFATRVMINALFLEVWNHKRSFEALQDVVTEYKLRLALETWEHSLELCEPETIVVPLTAPHKGHPLIFNAMAAYRNTRARLEVDLKPVQEALRYHQPYEVAAAMINARGRVKRSQEMIKVVQECFNCIEIVALQGIKSIGKTSATNWSVEHPLCGLDLMVILGLWLYRLEHDEEPATEEELAMYNKIRNLFDDDSIDSKLSTTVARLWGDMLNDVVVWGISQVMGDSFKYYSQALVGHEDEMAIRTSPSASTPTMSSQGVTESLEIENVF
ncbi:MAG: hypothetical protein LQ350_006030 [Teloschistes chrysophthalmus]|nr:MAG: hypothetical protein LQ350_006030 [Niorma chrysophthalma]